MAGAGFYASFARSGGLLMFLVLAATVMPELSFAHLLQGNKGPVDAYSYDEEKAAHLNDDCAEAFECRPNDIKGVYFYDCHYDAGSSECQCSEGEFSKCNAAIGSLDDKGVSRLKGNAGLLAIAGSITGPVKSAFGALSGLPLLAKVALIAVLVAAAFVLFSRLRDNASNNIRRAQSLHQQATALHEKGDEEGAKLLFEKAGYHREKAQQMMNNGMV